LKCNWCGKDQDQTDIIIAGPGVYICDVCVLTCTSQNGAQISAAGKSKNRCSFCGDEELGQNQTLHETKGAAICSLCLTACKEIIDEHKAHKTEHQETAGKCSCKEKALTPKESEWWEISEGASDYHSLYKQGKTWLKKNKTDVAAGPAIGKLLGIKPTSEVVAIGKSWLKRFPEDHSANEVIAALLKSASSPEIRAQARAKLRSSDDILSLQLIINAIINSKSGRFNCNRIADLIKRDPTNLGWSIALRCSSDKPTKALVQLKTLWFEINAKQTELVLFDLRKDLQSPEIATAALDWMRKGGRKSKYLPRELARFVRDIARYQPAKLPQVVRFARSWLKKNQDHEKAGVVFAAVLSATKAKKDIADAKQWYMNHTGAEDAWYVISDTLELTYWSGAKPDEYAVEQAHQLLEGEKSKPKPRLVGALLAVAPSPTTTALAKEIVERHKLLWIIVRLLRRAPDDETIATAEMTFPRWRDREDLEPEMLHALLSADPKNALARRRSKIWKKRNPKNQYIQAIFANQP
jgi:hypothetical protein